MRISKTSIQNDKTDVKKLYISLVNDIKKIIDCLSGRVRFGTGTDGARGENIAGEFQVIADTGNINTEFTVTHTVGAVPIGFLMINSDKGGVVYDSGTAWTSTNIYLKCSAANAAITIFLIQ